MKDIHITANMIQGWQREKARLRIEIQENQKKLDSINERLEAVRLLSPNGTIAGEESGPAGLGGGPPLTCPPETGPV